MGDPTTEPPDDLAPECRALEGCDGTPVALAGGETWLLRDGGLCNALDEIRDELYDQAQLGGEVAMGPVYECADRMLAANYDLTPAERLTLLAGAEPQALADAVLAALFGATAGRRTYTRWAAAALRANGLDPASLAGSERRDVLEQLVAIGRAIPASKWIDSVTAAPRLAAARARAQRRSAPAPEGEAP